MSVIALRLLRPVAVLLLCSVGLAAHAAADYLTPYAADVSKAIAPRPGDPTSAAPDNRQRESTACRSLKAQMERARQAPPATRDPVTSFARQADGTRRYVHSPGDGAQGELMRLEQQYRAQCP